MVTGGALKVQLGCRIDSFNLELEFEANSGITVITGPSGSGKSSVLNCIAGLRRPDRGLISCAQTVFFDSAKGINVHPRKRNCGYVLQNLALFPHMSVGANICYGIDKLPRDEQQKRLSDLLLLVKLQGMESRSISQLSGGQLQRVALARALAPKPGLLLLDEPFSALDAELREELGSELVSMQANLNIPVLLVTHSKAEALRLGQTMILMDQGKITASGDPRKLVSGTKVISNDSSVQFSW